VLQLAALLDLLSWTCHHAKGLPQAITFMLMRGVMLQKSHASAIYRPKIRVGGGRYAMPLTRLLNVTLVDVGQRKPKN